MIFQVESMSQVIGWCLVFAGLIVFNEIARRTKMGGVAIFLVIPALLTVYFVGMHLGAFGGATNATMMYMDGWFHYFKLYAAVAGCIGFMAIKYQIGIGKQKWFAWFPWAIVAGNIVIAVVSDFESALAAYAVSGNLSGAWWASNEGVFIYGGWWNIVNGIAGLINIFCMTGCVNLYTSKDKNQSDMIWADMTVWFIVAYDFWNFQYTYVNLPTHTWYCGFALLLAPTFANALWNRGAWIQNRANTLGIWCMFAQVFPLFQLSGKFQAALPVVYGGAVENGVTTMDMYNKAIEIFSAGAGKTAAAGEAISAMGITANPGMQSLVAMASFLANVLVISIIIKKSIIAGKNPYSNDVFVGEKDYEEAMARVAR